MVKKLKRLVLAWCVLFIAGMSLSGAQTFAKAKSFKCSETEMSSCLHNTPMNLKMIILIIIRLRKRLISRRNIIGR